jgi:hypothetical protein
LSLARYQKNSLPGLELSPIVQAGIYQLTPDRIVVLGYHAADETHRMVTLSVQGNPASAAKLDPSSRPVSYSIEVTLEERATPQLDDDLGWTAANATEQPVVDSAPIDPPDPKVPLLWTGHVVVLTRPSKELRLVVREFELFAPDSCHAGQVWVGHAGSGPSRRLVYADTIALT